MLFISSLVAQKISVGACFEILPVAVIRLLADRERDCARRMGCLDLSYKAADLLIRLERVFTALQNECLKAQLLASVAA